MNSPQRQGLSSSIFTNDLIENVVLLQVTSPLREVDDIVETVRVFERAKAATTISVNPDKKPNGAVYVYTRHALFEYTSWETPSLEYYEMPWNRSVDIDTAEDFKKAQELWREKDES